MTLKIGIMPREQFQKRMLDVAAGRTKANKDDPKIWFSSMKSLSEVLSDNNVRLLNRWLNSVSFLYSMGRKLMKDNKQRRKLWLSRTRANKAVSEAVKAIDPLIWIHEVRDTRGTTFKMMNTKIEDSLSAS